MRRSRRPSRSCRGGRSRETAGQGRSSRDQGRVYPPGAECVRFLRHRARVTRLPKSALISVSPVPAMKEKRQREPVSRDIDDVPRILYGARTCVNWLIDEIAGPIRAALGRGALWPASVALGRFLHRGGTAALTGSGVAMIGGDRATAPQRGEGRPTWGCPSGANCPPTVHRVATILEMPGARSKGAVPPLPAPTPQGTWSRV